jgi:hypothetical protein
VVFAWFGVGQLLAHQLAESRSEETLQGASERSTAWPIRCAVRLFLGARVEGDVCVTNRRDGGARSGDVRGTESGQYVKATLCLAVGGKTEHIVEHRPATIILLPQDPGDECLTKPVRAKRVQRPLAVIQRRQPGDQRLALTGRVRIGEMGGYRQQRVGFVLVGCTGQVCQGRALTQQVIVVPIGFRRCSSPVLLLMCQGTLDWWTAVALSVIYSGGVVLAVITEDEDMVKGFE